MTKLSTLVGAAVLAASSLAHAYPDPFSGIAPPLGGWFARSFAPIDEQGITGVISNHSDGTIWNHVMSSPVTGYLLRRGATSYGVSAVEDLADTGTGAPAVFVFSAETDGLYYLRITNRGASWDDSWCHVDYRTDLQSAPSAIYTVNGRVRVYARTSNSELVEWRLAPPRQLDGCRQVTGERIAGSVFTPPVAVSWSPTYSGSFGRIDVFATNTLNQIVHWWKAEESDDTYVSQLSAGETNIPTTIQVYPGTAVQASAMSKGIPGTMGLDVLYRGAFSSPYHLQWRAQGGWWNQSSNPVLPAAATVTDLATTWDPQGGLAWIAHGCSNASQYCKAAGWTDDMRLIGNQSPVFATSNATGVRSYTDPRGYRWLFVSDGGTGYLWWTVGLYTSAY